MNEKTLLQIAKDYGSPVYVYDAHKMEDQYNRLTAAFSKVNKLKINYAKQKNIFYIYNSLNLIR